MRPSVEHAITQTRSNGARTALQHYLVRYVTCLVRICDGGGAATRVDDGDGTAADNDGDVGAHGYVSYHALQIQAAKHQWENKRT